MFTYGWQNRTSLFGGKFQAESDAQALTQAKRKIPGLTLLYRVTDLVVLYDKFHGDYLPNRS